MAKTKHQKQKEAKERLEKQNDIYEGLSTASNRDLENLNKKLKL